MFEAYLGSVLIYTMVIGAMMCLFTDSIKANHWLDCVNHGNGNRFIGTVIVAAIPLIRLGVAIMMVYMAMHTKEDYEKWKSGLDK